MRVTEIGWIPSLLNEANSVHQDNGIELLENGKLLVFLLPLIFQQLAI